MNTKKEIPFVLQYPSDFAGCGFWRIIWPQYILNMQQKASVYHSRLMIRDSLHYAKVNVVHMQRGGLSDAQVAFARKLSQLKHRLKFRMIYEADDALFIDDVPKYNAVHEKIEDPEKLTRNIKELIELSDEMTVTNTTLKKYYLERTNQKNISIIPNYPPKFWIGHFYNEHVTLFNYHKHRKKPRILYSGSFSHFSQKTGNEQMPDDFSHVREAICQTTKEFQWIFVGSFPVSLEDLVKKGEIEYHSWKTMDIYPHYLATLNINMAIAPLQDNLFNRCKSDLKFLEAGALGVPIACQDITTYLIAPIRFKTGEEMLTKIRQTLSSEESYLQASRLSRQLVETRWLESDDNINKFVDLYSYPYGDPHRKYL